MSLILDALRKSEAQRRRGQLPALSLELPPATPRTSPTRAWWIALPIGIALAAIAIGLIRPIEQPITDPSAQVTEEPRPVVARPTEVAAAPDAEGDGAAGEGFEQARDGLRPALVAGRGLMPANPSPAASAPTPEATQPPAPDTPDASPATGSPILALSDLTPTERRALPPLKLSMHLWSDDPARRFVILDGHRLSEGDRAGNAVVQRIDPTGVILAADGRRIRLPLP